VALNTIVSVMFRRTLVCSVVYWRSGETLLDVPLSVDPALLKLLNT